MELLIILIMLQAHYDLLLLAILTSAGAAYVTVFQEVLHNAGYEKYQGLIGYLGTSMMAASIAGLFIMGRWIDYSRRY